MHAASTITAHQRDLATSHSVFREAFSRMCLAHAKALPTAYVAQLLAQRRGKPEDPTRNGLNHLPNISLDEWASTSVVTCNISVDAFLMSSSNYEIIGMIGFEPVYFWTDHGLYAFEQAFCTYELCFSYPWRAPSWLYKTRRNCQWEVIHPSDPASLIKQASLNF